MKWYSWNTKGETISEIETKPFKEAALQLKCPSLILAEVFLQEHNSDYPECPLTVAQDKIADHNR